MKHASFAFYVGAAAAALSAAVPAYAQEGPGSTIGPRMDRNYTRAPEPEVSAWDRVGLHGLEVQLRGFIAFGGSDSPVQAHSLYKDTSYNGPIGTVLNPASCPAGQSCTPYGFDAFAPGVAVGWRIRSRVSVGAFFSYASYNALNGADAGDAPDFTSQLSRSQWVLGAYGRYYFTWVSQRLQPWVELGVGYSSDDATYQRPAGQATNGQPETGFYTIGEKGLAVPMTVGLDWRLAPIFSVGPLFGFEPVFPLQGCVDVEFDQFSNNPSQTTCSKSLVQASVYSVFYAGLQVKVTIGPASR
jgi:hypothetical protein